MAFHEIVNSMTCQGSVKSQGLSEETNSVNSAQIFSLI